MKSPIFSILLPTKNRSHLVVYAVKSVLNQTFDDFELVIADNDDTEDSFNALKQYLSDKRIKYIRTGNLDMVENWNAALDNSIGNYVILLEDKMIFYKNALDTIYSNIESHRDINVIVWGRDIIRSNSSSKKFNLKFNQQDSSYIVRKSRDILNNFLQNRQNVWSTLPRGLCTVVNKNVIKTCLEEFKGPFYDYFSPDLVSALKILSIESEILYLDMSLNVIINKMESNGLKLQLGEGFKYFGVNPILDYVPIKDLNLVSNLIADDIENTLQYRKKTKFSNEKIWVTFKSGYVKDMITEIGNGVHYLGIKRIFRKSVYKILLFDNLNPVNLIRLFIIPIKNHLRNNVFFRKIIFSYFKKSNVIEIDSKLWAPLVDDLIDLDYNHNKSVLNRLS